MLNVPVDDSTKDLLESLSVQLLMAKAVQNIPSGPETPAMPLTGPPAVEVQQPTRDVDYRRKPAPPPEAGFSGLGSVQPPQTYDDNSHSQSSMDKNAGVKAALAQLLTQQGVSVSIGGSTVPTNSSPDRRLSHQASFSSAMSIGTEDSQDDDNFRPKPGGLPAETTTLDTKMQDFFDSSRPPPPAGMSSRDQPLFPIVSPAQPRHGGPMPTLPRHSSPMPAPLQHSGSMPAPLQHSGSMATQPQRGISLPVQPKHIAPPPLLSLNPPGRGQAVPQSQQPFTQRGGTGSLMGGHRGGFGRGRAGWH